MPSIGKRGPRTGVAIRVAIIVAIVASVLVIAQRAGLFALEDREQLAAAIERVRDVPFVTVMFVLVYAIAAAAGVPATPFTLAGGALFGIGWGIVLNWIGEMLAAMLAFAATRATGLRVGSRDSATAQPGDSATVTNATTRANQFSGAGGARMLFRLRLIPVAPFALLNAGAALSGMSWRNYVAATAIGIVPITVIYTISASALVVGVEGSGTRALTMAFGSAAVLVALSFIPTLIGARGRDKS